MSSFDIVGSNNNTNLALNSNNSSITTHNSNNIDNDNLEKKININQSEDSYMIYARWAWPSPITEETSNFQKALTDGANALISELGIEGGYNSFVARTGETIMHETLIFPNKESHFLYLTKYSGNVAKPIIDKMGFPTQYGPVSEIIIWTKNPENLEAYFKTKASTPTFDQMDDATREASINVFGLTKEMLDVQTYETFLEYYGFGQPVKITYLKW